MKQYPILIILYLLPFLAFSQLNIETTLQGGYEYNIFKNPDSLNNAEAAALEQSDLLQSAPLSNLGLAIDWKKKWNSHQLRLGSDASAQLFPSLGIANLWQVDLNQAYTYSMSKKIKFYQKASFRSKNRQGTDAASDVFFIANSYHQVELSAGLDWKPTKPFRIKLEGGKRLKNYQASETSALWYNETNAKLYTRYKFKKEATLQQIEFIGRWRNRLYTRERFEEPNIPIIEEELEEWEEDFDSSFEEYDMTYLIGNLAFKFQLNDQLSLKPAIEYTFRKSNENERLDYTQIHPIIGLNFKNDKTQIKWNTSYSFRTNPYLFPTSETEDALVYQYWRNSLEVEHQLTKKLAFIASINHILRLSNFDEASTRAYRPYDYTRILVGIKYQF